MAIFLFLLINRIVTNAPTPNNTATPIAMKAVCFGVNDFSSLFSTGSFLGAVGFVTFKDITDTNTYKTGII